MNYSRRGFRSVGIALILIYIISSSSHVDAKDIAKEELNVSEESLRGFVEQTISKQLKDYNIAGASVSIVKDGDILFTEAYGYSNEGERLEADSQTMFRIGSVTKLFTWTAIMQLMEQGKLQLDDDIKIYLDDIKLEGDYDSPITIRHLMTHTAGIEDKFSNLFMTVDEEIPELYDVLLNDQRYRIYEPDELIAYSNYGAALAGRIIEKVSGLPYEEYIQRNILNPLHMERTTLYQPASAHFSNVSKGHVYTKEGYKIYEDAFTQLPPIGAMSTSCEDISKFMLMHLGRGSYKGVTLMKEETARLMHKTHYVSDNRLPGICLGFMEWQRNDKRIIWHSGGTALFKTLLMLVPEESIGLFISYNSPNADKARTEFKQSFLDKFYSYEMEKVKPIEDYDMRAKRYEGYYREGRTAKYNSDKLIYTLSRIEKVTSNEDGTIMFRGKNYVEVGERGFNEVGGQGKLIFHEDENKQISYLYQDFEPHEAYVKIKWYQYPQMAITVFILCIMIFIAALANRGLHVILPNKHTYGECDKKLRKSVTYISLLHLLFPLGAVLGIGLELLVNPRVMTTGVIPLLFKLSMLFPVVSGFITIFTIPLIIKSLINRKLQIMRRIYYVIVVLASCIYLGWLYSWNLLGCFK